MLNNVVKDTEPEIDYLTLRTKKDFVWKQVMTSNHINIYKLDKSYNQNSLLGKITNMCQ